VNVTQEVQVVPQVNSEAVQRLEKAVTKSQRSRSVRFPIGFVRGDDPPLAKMMRGGQGGESRLRVYLLIRMMATAAPHDVPITATDIAACLGFPDPPGVGARRVNSALKVLASREHNLVAIEAPPGRTRTMKILRPDGSGEEWNDGDLKAPYITLPIALWKKGWLLALSGRALAIFIVLRELTGGRKANGAWADGIRKRQYGFSDDTWTRASEELRDRGLLTVDRETYQSQGEPRQRNVYQLHLDVLEDCRPFEHPLDPMREKARPRRPAKPAGVPIRKASRVQV
jgi:hypothetical protein